MPKTHAKDYLLEYASNPSTAGWMRDLIIRLVTSNGQLTDEDLTQSKEQLKANGVGALEMPDAVNVDEDVEISLTELIHHSGVNALASEQKIPFSPDITLLYGYNGTGKSSYFRILNEIVGGNREIRVHHNIFSQTPAPINVELKFTENGADRSITWNGTGRAIAPLTQASVFDSGYTDALLEKRSADTAIVKPLGLHLFTALTSAMDTIKERLGTEIDSITRSLPQIPQDNLGQVIKTILNHCEYSADQKKYITDRYVMSEETQKTLEESEKAYKELMSKDFDANIKLVNGERLMVQGLKTHLETAVSQLTKAQNATKDLDARLAAAEKAADEARKKIAILNEIGETGTAEWKTFVTAGDIYTKHAHLEGNTCPYCRQTLEEKAQAIVKAYGDYLADQSMATLKQLKEEKDEVGKRVARVQADFIVNETLEQLLGEELTTKTRAEIERLLKWKEGIALRQEIGQNQPENQSAIILSRIGELENSLTEKLNKLNEAKAGKEEQLKKLNETRLLLLEHQAIATQRALWEQWFVKVEHIRELSRLQNNISTRPISTLSKTASQQLLTDNLKQKFEEELKVLKLGYLEVSLSEEGASRGQSYMKIKLPSSIRTQEILSEGEQKGVALALFIAERRMENVKNPIILDDPVNSLDHHITACLVERLVELGNQIVIFSHHILLRDSLLALRTVHECNKLQIAGCGKQSKHLFLYNVNAREDKGYIRDSRQDNAKYYIQEAQRVLGSQNFDEATDIGKCAGLLRQAIEHMVDEKVFKNLVPVKYRGGKNQTIIWDRLKELQADPALIDMMHDYYNRLSGGDMHLGQESRENPIDWAELNSMATQLFAVE